MASHKNKSNISLESYVPLLVIFATVFIAAVALELRDSEWSWPTFGQFFMGLFLTVFAMFKMFNQQGFKDAFEMYDLVAQKVPWYAGVYPFIELFLGMMYLSETWIVLTNMMTFIVMVVDWCSCLDQNSQDYTSDYIQGEESYAFCRIDDYDGTVYPCHIDPQSFHQVY